MASTGKSGEAKPAGRGAGPQQAGGRVRAWVLVRSADPHAAAQALSAAFVEGNDRYVIIRADVVSGPADLIVPVDAKSEADLEAALGIIRDRTGDASPGVARVGTHYPRPPHRAHAFVTSEELEEFDVPEFRPAGRHGASPGRNGWG